MPKPSMRPKTSKPFSAAPGSALSSLATCEVLCRKAADNLRQILSGKSVAAGTNNPVLISIVSPTGVLHQEFKRPVQIYVDNECIETLRMELTDEDREEIRRDADAAVGDFDPHDDPPYEEPK